MTSRTKFPGVDVLSVKYPSKGAHVIYVHTGPMRTDSITPFGNWVCDQLDGYIGKFEGAKAQPSGVVHFTFYRQKDGEITAPSLSRVDRETIAKTLGARYTRELVANTAFIHRDEDGYHDGTVIKLYLEDGELFDTTHAEAIRALDVVQDVTLDEKSCLFTMAAPARNDDDGAITAVIKAVAEVLGSEYDPIPVKVEDNPHLALMRKYDYRPPKRARKVAGD